MPAIPIKRRWPWCATRLGSSERIAPLALQSTSPEISSGGTVARNRPLSRAKSNLILFYFGAEPDKREEDPVWRYVCARASVGAELRGRVRRYPAKPVPFSRSCHHLHGRRSKSAPLNRPYSLRSRGWPTGAERLRRQVIPSFSKAQPPIQIAIPIPSRL